MRRATAALATAALTLGGVVLSASAAQAEVEPGDTAYIGSKQGYGGTGLWPVWLDGSDRSGEPDFWTYCIEHDLSARSGLEGYVGDAGDFLGVNYFTNSTIQGKVLWVLKHSYPNVSLEEFGAASRRSGDLAQ